MEKEFEIKDKNEYNCFLLENDKEKMVIRNYGGNFDLDGVTKVIITFDETDEKIIGINGNMLKFPLVKTVGVNNSHLIRMGAFKHKYAYITDSSIEVIAGTLQSTVRS